MLTRKCSSGIDFDIVLYDISSFFLYGEIFEARIGNLHAYIPLGWEGNEDNTSDNVWKLQGALYGMSSAPPM